MTALDTNVLIDIEEGDTVTAELAVAAIERSGQESALVVCGVVYAELCARASRKPIEVAAALNAARITIDADLPVQAWANAGIAYAAYRRRRETSGGGGSRRILADFIIGAHACQTGTLVTSDADFYRRAFPDLRVVDVRS